MPPARTLPAPSDVKLTKSAMPPLGPEPAVSNTNGLALSALAPQGEYCLLFERVANQKRKRIRFNELRPARRNHVEAEIESPAGSDNGCGTPSIRADRVSAACDCDYAAVVNVHLAGCDRTMAVGDEFSHFRLRSPCRGDPGEAKRVGSGQTAGVESRSIGCRSISPLAVVSAVVELDELNSIIWTCLAERTTMRNWLVGAAAGQTSLVDGSQNCMVPRPSGPIE